MKVFLLIVAFLFLEISKLLAQIVVDKHIFPIDMKNVYQKRILFSFDKNEKHRFNDFDIDKQEDFIGLSVGNSASESFVHIYNKNGNLKKRFGWLCKGKGNFYVRVDDKNGDILIYPSDPGFQDSLIYSQNGNLICRFKMKEHFFDSEKIGLSNGIVYNRDNGEVLFGAGSGRKIPIKFFPKDYAAKSADGFLKLFKLSDGQKIVKKFKPNFGDFLFSDIEAVDAYGDVFAGYRTQPVKVWLADGTKDWIFDFCLVEFDSDFNLLGVFNDVYKYIYRINVANGGVYALQVDDSGNGLALLKWSR